MALSDEQKAALDLVKQIGQDDTAEAATLVKGAPVYQHVFKGGFTEAETRWKARATEAEEKVKLAEAKAGEAEGKLAELQGKAPDAERLNAEWIEKLRKAEEKAAGEVSAARSEAESARAEHLSTMLELALNEQGLDSLYTRVARDAHKGRIRPKQGGGFELLEEGGETPVVLKEGETPFARLAKDIASQADPKWRISRQAGGAGDKGGNDPSGSGYDPAAAGKAAAEAQKKRNAASDLSLR